MKIWKLIKFRKSQHWLNNDRPLWEREQNEHHIEASFGKCDSSLSWKDPAVLVKVGCVQAKPYGVFYKASSKKKKFNIFDPGSQKEEHLCTERMVEHIPKELWKAGHGLSRADGSFIKRRQTSGVIWAHYCAEEWRSGDDCDNQL